MGIGTTVRTLLAGLVLSTAANAQTAPAQKPAAAPPCPPASQTTNPPASSSGSPSSSPSASPSTSQDSSKPCTPPPADTRNPSAAKRFPFPGEATEPDAKPDTDAPTPNAPHPSAASQHPFPGKTTKPDADSPNAPHPSAATEHPFPGDTPPDADSGSSSSSSSSSDDVTAPIGPPLHDEGSEGKTTRHRLRAQKSQTDDQRVDEDLRIAKFYTDSGNLMGAYLRAKDAVKIQPDYSETRFVLGQIAQKLKKKDEAIAEYKAYLTLDPNGERRKAVQKALDELE